MNQFLRCLILEDDDASILLLTDLIRQVNFLELVGSCKTVIEASRILEKEKIDILFLDIELPGISGLDYLNMLKVKPAIIVTTCDSKYAVKSFDYDVTDFILKPVTMPRFYKAILKAKKMLASEGTSAEVDESIFVKVDGKLIKINTKDIYYIEGHGDYVKIHTKDAGYLTNATIKNILAQLSEKDFIRVHKSYVIRLDKINDIEVNNVLIEGKIIPIGDTYKPNLMSRLKII